MSAPDAARRHLAALAAEPRPAGGAAEARARAYAAGVLAAAGYRVREEPFTYSSAVGRYGAPVAGAASLLVLAAAALAGMRDRPAVAGATLLGALAALVAAAGWVSREGVLRLPLARRSSVNLVAEPPAADGAAEAAEPPRVWLVAHLDSKSQPVAMSLRVAGVSALVAAWVAAFALAAAHGAGWMDAARAQRLWPALAVLAAAGALPVSMAVVGARSAGALDNASGTAAVLLAAEGEGLRGLPDDITLGVLLTSAEELGLAGARAWVAARGARGEPAGLALNCDGVDDGGRTTVMLGARVEGRVVEAVRAAATARGAPVDVRRLVPGILVDAVALAAGGWATLTVSRGTWRTLARIHTAADRVERLDGRGVVEVAGLLRDAAVRLARAG